MVDYSVGTARIGVLALLALAAGCEGCDEPLGVLQPSLLVEPSIVEVTGAAVAQDTELYVTLKNPSNVPLTVNRVDLDTEVGDPAFRLLSWPSEVLAGGEGNAVIVVRPMLVSTIRTTLRIEAESSALPSPYVEVPLIVQASDLGLPSIVVNPTCVEFDGIGQLDVAFASVTIANEGVRDLVLDDVSFVPAQEGDNSIRVQGGVPPGFVVAPRESISVSLAFAPLDTNLHEGNLRIQSNDPDEPVVAVCAKGAGSSCPVAVAEVLEDDSAIEPLDTLRLFGGDSFTETEGAEIAEYRWRLALRPPGSTATLSTLAEPQTQITVDIAGIYEVCLEVEDSFGVRSCNDACTRLEVIPTDALHVQLVWDHPRADLDLHLLREGGSAFTHEGDCYFSNRTPAWFEPAEANPTLDADDSEGYGPENINIESPLPGSRWRVLVHYWNSQTDGDPFAVATLRLYAYGQLVGEYSHSFEEDEVLWQAVDVTWSTVVPTPEAPIYEPPLVETLGTTESLPRPFGG
ncbi:MAG: hypothetical protein ACO3JL_08805 [Myxococcota bacterium]